MVTEVDVELVSRLMAELAVDRATVVPFVAAFGDRIAGVVRRVLGDFGRHDLARDADEVRGLVWDVALVIQQRAAGWQPGAALPWSWAYPAVRSEIARSIGHAAVALDVDQVDLDLEGGDGGCRGGVGGPTEDAGADVDLVELAQWHPAVALLCTLLDELGVSEQHRRVHVEYRVQSSLGDPSPAHTVGAQYGVTPANVRQIDRRVRRRLAQAVEADPRYGALEGIPWITARPVGPSDGTWDAA